MGGHTHKTMSIHGMATRMLPRARTPFTWTMYKPITDVPEEHLANTSTKFGSNRPKGSRKPTTGVRPADRQVILYGYPQGTQMCA